MLEPNSAALAPKGERKTVIHFKKGIYGFENVKEYVLLQEDDRNVIWSLQAANRPYPSLIVLDPFLVLRGYRPELSPKDLGQLGNPPREDLCFLAVAVIRKKLADSVVNLKSPIVINTRTQEGMQVILENGDYPVRYRPFQKIQRG